MNLKAVHIVFVTCASLLAFGFGGWCLARDETTYTILGGLSLVMGMTLVVYGFWFWRKITTTEEERRRRRKLIRGAAFAAVTFLLPLQRAVLACSVCYGEAEGPMIDAARMGVYLLFGLILLIQGSFAGFFIYLWRRARRHRQSLESTHRPSLYLKES